MSAPRKPAGVGVDAEGRPRALADVPRAGSDPDRESGTTGSPPKADFEPPKYLSSLIASINDGAKGAQTGALFFLGVGLYLLAVAFSTTDEDLLRERTFVVSQIGVAVPVVFSFAVAPLVFVFFHLHTLIRYDMLAANLRQFDDELKPLPDEQSRERCRHLLANVEFLRGHGTKPGSTLTSRLFHAMSWFMLAAFPLAVLTIVQLSALRYQDEGIIGAQRVALLADAGLLVWFYQRLWRVRQPMSVGRWRAAGRLALRCLGPVPMLVFNLAYMGVPGFDARTVGHQATDARRWSLKEALGTDGDYLAATIEFVSGAWQQPVDSSICLLNFGCRYLRVPFTLLTALPPQPEALARLRDFECAPSLADLKSIQGLNLRHRTLRFIDLEGSRLYAAALTWTDARGAYLRAASLQDADLLYARLQGADLLSARLQGATLEGAQLDGADLSWARLQGANLEGAQLDGADLLEAQLQGTNLLNARLWNAQLLGAQLQGANLSNTQLWGAELSRAQLQGANLSNAWLHGAELYRAQLQGAELSGTQMQGASLLHANLWQTRLNKDTDLSGTDLVEITFDPLTESESREALRCLSEGARREAEQRLMPGAAPAAPAPVFQVYQPVLVSELPRSWQTRLAKWITQDRQKYESDQSLFLYGLAFTNDYFATEIALKIIRNSSPADLAHFLLKALENGDIKLAVNIAEQLRPIAAKTSAAEDSAPAPDSDP